MSDSRYFNSLETDKAVLDAIKGNPAVQKVNENSMEQIERDKIILICEIPFPLRTHEQWSVINEAALKYTGYPNHQSAQDDKGDNLTGDNQGDRTRFEQWILEDGHPDAIKRNSSGNYTHMQVDLCWEGWKAALK